jgi:hypothetical protein
MMFELTAISAVPRATTITKGRIQIPIANMNTRNTTRPNAGIEKPYSHYDE